MHFRVAKLTLDYPKQVFDLDAYLGLGVFDLAPHTTDQALFPAIFFSCWAAP